MTMNRMFSCLPDQPVLLAIYLLCAIGNTNAAETLTVYTYDSFVSEWGPGPKLEQLFEARCECDLRFIAAEDGVSILNRMRIEGDKSNADVVLGLDNGLLAEAKATGLFQQHQTNTSHLLPDLAGPDRAWQDKYFIPFDFGFFAFVYDADKTDQPATSFAELLRSESKIIYQDPRTSTPGQGLLMWVNAIYGARAAEAWQQIAPRTLTVTKGWWEAYSMFLEGAADYVLSYTTSPAYHIITEGKYNFKAAKFSEGHIRQIEVAGISASAKNPALANQFLQFLISPEAQQIIPVTNWMLPVIEDVNLPPAFATLISPESIGYTPTAIAQNRRLWIKEWRASASR